MRVAILQPAYLPWLGYFDLLDQVDRFVLLDSVQFEKRSWQQRNRIKAPGGLQWLTVPVVSRGKRDQRIVEVEILDADFWRDHLRAIELNCRRAPFFDEYFGELGELIRSEAAHSNLSRLTIAVIRWLAKVLGIRTPILRSSEMPVEGKRSSLLAEICVTVGGSAYLSSLGSTDYLLDELQIFDERGIAVSFQHYEHPVYKQLFPPFQPYACVLDLLFNEGSSALEIIRSGRRAPFPPDEARAYLSEKVSL